MLTPIAFGLALTFSPTLPAPDAGADVLRVDYILPAQRAVTYGPTGELRWVSRLPMTPDAQATFDAEFATQSYYSAFAYAKSGGWGYATTSNSLGAARSIAMGHCLSMNDSCTIVAEIVPPGYVDPGPGDITMSPEVTDVMADPNLNQAVAALAISADGAYAAAWGYPAQAQAEAIAMSDCEANRIQDDLPGLIDMPCVLVPLRPAGAVVK